MIPSAPDDRDVLAGEYVLGLLDTAQTDEVERALAVDTDLAARVAFWEARLSPLVSLVEPDEPDEALWARIEREARAAGVSPLAAEAVRRSAARRPPRTLARSAWRSLPVWRGASALATAAALVLGLLLARESSRPETAPRFFVVLQGRDAGGAEVGPGWVIQVAADGTLRSLPLGEVDPGRGRSLQLWTLWDQARGPVSLGVLPPGGSVRLPAERLPVIGGGQLFEITLEPEAGSPTGRPTGRILFIGRASRSVTQAL